MADEETKYEQIAYDVRRKIIQGVYQKNEQLPLEREMEATYGVSRITIKRAIDTLVNEGFVVKRRGAGTFVKDFDPTDLSEGTANFQGFTERFANSQVSSDVLVFTIELASEEVAEKMRITATDFVYHIERTRFVDKKPMTYQISFIPINLLMGLRIDNVTDSLFQFARDVGGVKIQSAHRNLSAVMPTEVEQKALKITAGTPLLQIESQVFLDTGQIFEYELSKYRSDRYTYHTIELS